MNKSDKYAIWVGPLILDGVLASLVLCDLYRSDWGNERVIARIFLIFGIPTLYPLLSGFAATKIIVLRKLKKTNFSICCITGVAEGVIVALFFASCLCVPGKPSDFWGLFLFLCPYSVSAFCFLILFWWWLNRENQIKNPNKSSEPILNTPLPQTKRNPKRLLSNVG